MKKNMLLNSLAIILAVFLSIVASASNVPDGVKKEQILKEMHGIRVPFIENKGQIDNGDVKFYARTFGGTVFVDENGFLSYCLFSENDKGVVLKEIFSDKKLNINGLNFSPTSVNYFKGKDKNNWKTDIPSYNSISLGEVYKGIEVTLQVQGNTVEKLFTVSPNENPEQIKIQLDGCKELIVNESGELEVITDLGKVKFTKPIAFQKINGQKKTIDVAYVIKENNFYSFQVGNYDKTMPLFIDPLLASTFIGSLYARNSNFVVFSIITDDNDNIYIADASDFSSNYYPTTSGAYNESQKKGYYISKLNSNLTTLLASTFIGYGDIGDDISMERLKGPILALDHSGNIFITGDAGNDFPTTPGAYRENSDREKKGDIFVSKLNPGLNTLLSSTLIGGAGFDLVSSLALDSNDNVYIVGTTNSSDYPVSLIAYDKEINNSNHKTYDELRYKWDVVVSKLNSNLTTLLASTFIGGRHMDRGSSIALDGNGNVYVTGNTESTDYPTTSGAYVDSFILKDYLELNFRG